MLVAWPEPKSKILAHWLVDAGLTQAAMVKSVSPWTIPVGRVTY
jgi:hypothetical protein